MARGSRPGFPAPRSSWPANIGATEPNWTTINATSTNPLTDLGITWYAAWWASDPSWTAPADGATVASWRDGSGGTAHQVQATETNKPLYRAASANLNGKPGIEYDGTDNFTAAATWASLAQPFTVVIIHKLLTINAGNQTQIFYPDIAKNGSDNRSAYYGGTVTRGAATTNVEAWRIYANGANSEFSAAGTTATGNAGANALGSAPNLASTGGAQFSNVIYGFVGVFNGDLSAQAGWADLKTWASDYYGATLS